MNQPSPATAAGRPASRSAWLPSASALLRYALAGLFIYAGVAKALDVPAFVADLASFRMMSPRLCGIVARVLPWAEISCGLALLLPRVRLLGSLALAFLMSLFIGLITTAWLRGIPFRCGCFGARHTPADYWWLLVRDLLILGGLVICCLWEAKLWRPRSSSALRVGDNQPAPVCGEPRSGG
jgi:uncharacterized membrane protein YphA (DoxX/SURF4 family)